MRPAEPVRSEPLPDTSHPLDVRVLCLGNDLLADDALGFRVARARSVRLDETPTQEHVRLDGHALRFVVPPRALRSIELT